MLMKINKNKYQIYNRVIAFILLLSFWFISVFISLLVITIGNSYMGTMDISFEYIGKETLNFQELKNVEISSALYGGSGYNFWAYIADNEEEYCINYGECGMSRNMYKELDYDNYIMVMSLNRPLTAIRIMINSPVWENSIPYSYPQFVFGREYEEKMVYYYKIYRFNTIYQRNGQEIVSKLKLWMEPYSERKSNKLQKPEPMIESWLPFKKWKWTFDIFNNI